MMLEIIDQGFPPSFRVLCYNCNSGRARNRGVCPHQAIYDKVMGGEA